MKLEWVSKNLLKIYFKTFFFSFLTAQQSGSFLQKEYIYVFMKFDWNTYFHIMYYQNLMKFDWVLKTLWWILESIENIMMDIGFLFQIILWKKNLKTNFFFDCATKWLWFIGMSSNMRKHDELPLFFPLKFAMNNFAL